MRLPGLMGYVYAVRAYTVGIIRCELKVSFMGLRH